MAADDAYDVPSEFTFDSATQGAAPILANDGDIDDADPISVDLLTVSPPAVAPPANLVVDADGSFTYTPPSGYTGLDSFTYRAEDSFGLFSGLATVTFNVVPDTPPDADFTPSSLEATYNEPIAFTDQSSDADANDMVKTWFWEFGDGFTSSEQNPSHQYGTAGKYAVCLTVTDKWGVSGITCKFIQIGYPDNPPSTGGTSASTPPVAFAGQDQTVVEGTRVDLHGSINGADAHFYQWSQSGGPPIVLNNSTVADAWFLAPMVGSAPSLQLSFELRVSDGHLDSLPDTVMVNVVSSNTPPVAKAGTSIEAHRNEIVTLDGLGSSDLDGDPLTYEWTAPAGSGIQVTDATSPHARFTVPAGAVGTTLVFTLRVSDGRATTVDSLQVLVTPEVYDGPGFAVAAGDDGTITATPALVGAYLWDFGDGSGPHPSDGPTTHAYASSGTYAIRLTVHGPDGSIRSFTHEQEVMVPPGLPQQAAVHAAAAPSPTSEALVWVVLAGAALLALGGLAFAFARRRN
jgi:PKD repeat protein